MSFSRVADGIYVESSSGHYYERPWLHGRRTWRRLDGHTLRLAKESLAQRRADLIRSKLGLAPNPYAPKAASIGELLDAFETAGCPMRDGRPRSPEQLVKELSRIRILRPFWQARLVTTVKPVQDCMAYFDKRKAARAVQLELNTLSGALEWAVSRGLAESNPLVDRPRFRPKVIRHCRECAPRDAEEAHSLARHLFEDPRSASLGWQLLVQWMTGTRANEVVALRWDAACRDDPGFIEGDWLWLRRAKGGINPFALVHPALRECVEALRSWHGALRRKSPFWFPSPKVRGQPVATTSLTHALATAGKLVLGRHITSQGLRSAYVTFRRSQGASDAQVAAEIGDRTGAPLIANTYGDIPPNWRGTVESLSWKPTGEPAWSVFTGIKAGLNGESQSS